MTDLVPYRLADPPARVAAAAELAARRRPSPRPRPEQLFIATQDTSTAVQGRPPASPVWHIVVIVAVQLVLAGVGIGWVIWR